MNRKVLFVDDDKNILRGYELCLRKRFTIATATTGQQGLLTLASDGPFSVVVADMRMPTMDGVEFLAQAEVQVPNTVRIMLTGNIDQGTATEAVNRGGVFRFLNKPAPSDILIATLEAAVKQAHLENAERELLDKTLNGTVSVITEVLAAVDTCSFGRSKQLLDYVRTLLADFKIGQPWEVEIAAMLSAIGRVTLPPTLLSKERDGVHLTPEEADMLFRVPEVGARLLEQIPRLENVARIVRLQQARCVASTAAVQNGAESVPIGARIIKVLGNLVKLEAKGVSKAAALLQMLQADQEFDADIVRRVTKCFDISLPSLAVESPAPISILIEDLQFGQVLCADVQTTDSVLLLVAGTILSPMLVERLRNFHALGTIPNAVFVRA